jgi:hypothetical protein
MKSAANLSRLPGNSGRWLLRSKPSSRIQGDTHSHNQPDVFLVRQVTILRFLNWEMVQEGCVFIKKVRSQDSTFFAVIYKVWGQNLMMITMSGYSGSQNAIKSFLILKVEDL